MRIRPCIDIHNGRVKQIVGSTLKDQGDRSMGTAVENFVADRDASYYASVYRDMDLRGGHIILLNSVREEAYKKDMEQAMGALAAFPGGMQIGGGITADNAAEYLAAGASHVIVTSYVFRNGKICWENLEKLVRAAGKEHIVLDLSCRRRDGAFYIMTDRWQKFTDTSLSAELFEKLSQFCAEFLVHAIDVEGQNRGIDRSLAELLAAFSPIPATYAGGVGSFEDIETLHAAGRGRIDFTIGSHLDLFGGELPYEEVICRVKELSGS